MEINCKQKLGHMGGFTHKELIETSNNWDIIPRGWF